MSNFFDVSDMNLDDATPLGAAEEGEYTVAIASWKMTDEGGFMLEDKNGYPYIMPQLEVVDCPEAESTKSFYHFIRIPHSDEEPKAAKMSKWLLKTFFDAFEIDYNSQIDFEDLIGKRAEAILIVQEDSQYGDSNRVKQWVAGA